MAYCLRYADHADGVVDAHLPDESGGSPPAGGWPVVVLVHGGFWRGDHRRDLMDPLVPSLLERRFAVWNVEYRRVGSGGGWPMTLDDLAAAVDLIATTDLPVDVGQVAVVGHSAGGHLALWAGSRPKVPAGSPGAEPAVVPSLAVSQAGVTDLVGAARDEVGGTAVPDLLGGSVDRVPARYEAASPMALLPVSARIVLTHGADDDLVPLEQSRRYHDAAVGEGLDVALVIDDTSGHFEHLDPTHLLWGAVLEHLERWRDDD